MSNSGAKDIAVPGSTPQGKTAPTPVNTPLNTAPISQGEHPTSLLVCRVAHFYIGLSRPTIPDTIDESMSGDEDVEEGPPDAAAQAIFNLVHGACLIPDGRWHSLRWRNNQTLVVRLAPCPQVVSQASLVAPPAMSRTCPPRPSVALRLSRVSRLTTLSLRIR